MKNFKLFFLVIFAISFSGCATMEMQKQAKTTKPIFLDKSIIKNSTIYLQVNNIEQGGGDNINLQEKLSTLLEQKGYKLVNESKDSDIKLFVDVLFVNNIKEALALKATLGYGTAGTIVTYAGTRSGSDALGVGLAMALGSAVVGKALEDETYRGIFAVKIEDSTKEYSTKIFTEVVKVNLEKKEAFLELEGLSSNKIASIF